MISHIYKVLEREGKAKEEGLIVKHKEEIWASELSDCCQGLALARLIFNGNNREEDGAIADMLHEALKLRESLKDKALQADTHNSLGSLAQKQKDYEKADKHYLKSLELREASAARASRPVAHSHAPRFAPHSRILSRLLAPPRPSHASRRALGLCRRSSRSSRRRWRRRSSSRRRATPL